MRLRWDRVLAPPRDEPPPDDNVDAHDVSCGSLQLVDRALCAVAARGLVSGVEVVDLLLDVRSAIVLDTAFAAVVEELGAASASIGSNGGLGDDRSDA